MLSCAAPKYPQVTGDESFLLPAFMPDSASLSENAALKDRSGGLRLALSRQRIPQDAIHILPQQQSLKSSRRLQLTV